VDVEKGVVDLVKEYLTEDFEDIVDLAVMGLEDIVDLAIGGLTTSILVMGILDTLIASTLVTNISGTLITGTMTMNIFPLAFSSDSALELYSHSYYTHTILIPILFILMILIRTRLPLSHHMATLRLG
jgi:hypothetical protein